MIIPELITVIAFGIVFCRVGTNRDDVYMEVASFIVEFFVALAVSVLSWVVWTVCQL